MEPLDCDAMAIWSHMQHHEKELWQKRKFLLGLSTSASFDQNVRSHAVNQSILPESFLRKDDVFYENVKNFVEKGFGVRNTETEELIVHGDIEFSDLRHMSRIILTLLDDLSNNGLYHLAKLLTRGLVAFEKTRSQMKKVIKKSLSEIQGNQWHSDCQVTIQNQISELLKNPRNFRQNHLKHLNLTSKSHHGAVMKVLDGLEDMPSQTLSAMHRKLRGMQGIVPQLHHPRSGWSRDRLIDRVRRICMDLIYQLGESDKLQEPLAKAMAVAGLSSKLASGCQDLSAGKFVHITPELEALQNEIVKAIRSLKRRIKKREMKNLQRLLDPESEVDSKGLKSAIKNMLINFLFECSDMGAIPDTLLDALSVINKTSRNPRRFFSKDIIEEEVECILNVGAHIKQILWNCVPDDKLDQDFEDAYMEELEESDDGDFFDNDGDDDEQQLHSTTAPGVEIRFNDFNEEVESTGSPDRANFGPPSSTCKYDFEDTNEFASSSSFWMTPRSGHDVVCIKTEVDEGETLISTPGGNGSSSLVSSILQDSNGAVWRPFSANSKSMETASPAGNKCYSTVLSSEKNQMPEYENISRNRYIVLQEVCDQASLVAYRLIGCVLGKFGQKEGLGLDWDDESYLGAEYSRECFQDSAANSIDEDISGTIIVEAVKKVIPSFSNSELEMVKKFMSS